MMINFTKRFSELINQDVPRTVMHTAEDLSVRGTAGRNNYPEPVDGFVKHYCQEGEQ